jgi:hypothetical protein
MAARRCAPPHSPSGPRQTIVEERHLLEVLRSRKWSVFSGDKVKTFEERFARYQGARFATCVPNGTLALELALMALGLEPGDEIIVPGYTFIATVSAGLRLGQTGLLSWTSILKVTPSTPRWWSGQSQARRPSHPARPPCWAPSRYGRGVETARQGTG